MALVTTTISQTAKSITTRATFGAAYAPAVDGMFYLAVSLSALNGAAATITADVEITRSSLVYALDDRRFSVTKRSATATRANLLIGPIPVIANDSIQLYLQSTNSSDTVVTGTIQAYDATSADVRSISTGAITAAAFAANAIAAASIASDALGAIAGGVWNALTSGLTTVGSIGKLLVTNIDALISSRLAPTVNGRTLNVDTSNRAKADLEAVANSTSTVPNLATNASQAYTYALANNTAIGILLTNVANLNNLSALANLYGPTVLEIPDSGTAVYGYTLIVRDSEGHLVDLDATPTITVVNPSGTSRAGNLSAVSHPSTAVYEFTYTVAAADAKESLHFAASGAVNSSPRRADFFSVVVDYDTQTLLAAAAASAAAAATSAASADGKATTIQTKTDLVVAAPANWSSLQINSSGHVSRVTVTDTATAFTGYAAPPTTTDMVTAINANARVKLAAVQPDYAPFTVAAGTTLQNAVNALASGGSAVGPGASPTVVRVTIDGAGVPDADVWVTSDAAGAHTIAGTLQTDSDGKATFLLDTGVTYYLWAQKDGVNAIQGEAFVAQ